MTVTFVAITTLARRSPPDASLLVRLVLLMLPIQFAIGVMNDVADAPEDALTKPYKPLVRGVVPRLSAAVAGVVLAAGGLVSAATLRWDVLGLAAVGLCAGLLYDLGLRRTPLSWAPWWGGVAALPLAAYAAAGHLSGRLLALLPLTLLLSFGLHCANALPDIESDRTAGRRSLPVVLGERNAAAAAVGALLLTAVVALALYVPLQQRGVWVPVAAAAFLLVVTAVAIARPRRPFPVLAVVTAGFAVAWLAALPA